MRENGGGGWEGYLYGSVRQSNIVIAAQNTHSSSCKYEYNQLGAQYILSIFHSHTLNLDIKVLLPTDAQEKCFKKSTKIYIKTATTCFGVITIIRGRTI
jgi:hypothetical protein